MRRHNLKVIISQHAIVRENIVGCLQEVHEVYSPAVPSKISAFNVAGFANFYSGLIWDEWGNLLLKGFKPLAGYDKRAAFAGSDDAHIILLGSWVAGDD